MKKVIEILIIIDEEGNWDINHHGVSNVGSVSFEHNDDGWTALDNTWTDIPDHSDEAAFSALVDGWML